MPRYDAAVVIGRFQPLHHAHLSLLRRAFDMAEQVVVVIGSAFQARSPRNPFSAAERRELLRLAIGDADCTRLRVLPVRDHYDDERWAGVVRQGVEQQLRQAGLAAQRIVLVGHHKDATSGYLDSFPGWALERVPRLAGVGATAVRDAWFGAAAVPGALPSALAALVDPLPDSTREFLRAWSALPAYAELAEEWQRLADYRRAWSGSPYPPVFVTVDAVVHCGGQVLLIRRGQPPGRGLLAVPGGFIEQRETLWQSCLRELREETCLDLPEALMRRAHRESAVFDHPDRSQRGRMITHAMRFDLGDGEPPAVQAADDAASVQWLPIAALPPLEDQFHDDHFHMLDHFFGLTGEPLAGGA
jgi:bifunctional NMN adenylyltransferase/nudix hydrolase